MESWHEHVPQLGTFVFLVYCGLVSLGILAWFHQNTRLKTGRIPGIIAWPFIKAINHIVIQIGVGYGPTQPDAGKSVEE